MFSDIKHCWAIFYPAKLKMTYFCCNLQQCKLRINTNFEPNQFNFFHGEPQLKLFFCFFVSVRSTLRSKRSEFKLYFDQNAVFFICFLLIFIEIHFYLHTIVVYQGSNCLTIIIQKKNIHPVRFEVRFDRPEPNFLQKNKKIFEFDSVRFVKRLMFVSSTVLKKYLNLIYHINVPQFPSITFKCLIDLTLLIIMQLIAYNHHIIFQKKFFLF